MNFSGNQSRLSMAWINKAQTEPSSNTKSAGGGGFGSMKTNQDMEEELKTQHASGHVSPELEQLLLRMRVDKLMTERTTDAQTTFMNTMEEILKELGPEHSDTLGSLSSWRDNHRRRTNEYRQMPFYQGFPQFLRGNEHTNMFLHHNLNKYLMYPAKHAQIERIMFEDDIAMMSRADSKCVVFLSCCGCLAVAVVAVVAVVAAAHIFFFSPVSRQNFFFLCVSLFLSFSLSLFLSFSPTPSFS